MNAQRARKDEIVPLGYVSGVHGVQGWVKIHSWTQPREAILDYQPWLLGEAQAPVHILAGQRHGKTVIARLPGIEDRDQALELARSRQRIAVRRDQLPEPGDGQYYWADLEGLQVITVEGDSLGRVAGLLETGANDVMIVEGDRQRLVPFVPGRYVQRVDLAAGQVVVDWDPED